MVYQRTNLRFSRNEASCVDVVEEVLPVPETAQIKKIINNKKVAIKDRSTDSLKNF
jgi:hypothetical protein